MLFENLALTGTTIEYIDNEKINKVLEYSPDYIIIFYGNVDSMPRPNRNSKINILKILPKRFLGNGMLNPRALYTTQDKKIRILQKIDSKIRIFLNKLLIKIQGYEQWYEIDKYEKKYKEILDKLENQNIIVISPVPMYEKYFPYANEQVLKYIEKIKKIINERERVYYLDLYSIFSQKKKEEVFLDDFFHPNYYGYELISLEIKKIIENKELLNKVEK